MGSARFRLRLSTGLVLVAFLAIPLSFARNATRRVQFCWQQQAVFAAIEQRMRALGTRSVYAGVAAPSVRKYAVEAAAAYRWRKWRYRWEALRFWEPSELVESEPYNR